MAAVTSRAEVTEPERVLDGPQHAVMVDGPPQARAAAHEPAGDDGGDPATVRSCAASAVRRPFVPGEHHVPLRAYGAEQRRHEVRQEAVSGGNAAIVRVVAEVGRDERV